MELLEYVAKQIRELRENYSPEGLSQEALAAEIGVATNTISRWETGRYRPAIEDLEKLARFSGKSITYFFPPEEVPADENIMGLLRTAKQLAPEDLEELKQYAEFRRVRSLYEKKARPRVGRKGEKER